MAGLNLNFNFMIPNQDKLVDYLDTTQNPPSEEVEAVSPFQSNFMTTSKARKRTRDNLRELERLTGSSLNIII